LDAYIWISNEVNEPFENLMVIANDWKNDLAPIDALGGNTILIESKK